MRIGMSIHRFLVHNPVKRSNDGICSLLPSIHLDDTPSFKTKRTHKDVGLKKKDNSGLVFCLETFPSLVVQSCQSWREMRQSKLSFPARLKALFEE